jgi:hypothetical protein
VRGSYQSRGAGRGGRRAYGGRRRSTCSCAPGASQPARRCRKRAVADIIEIGRRLIEAKAIAGHGGWLPWLEREFGWGETSARGFMDVAYSVSKNAKLADLNVDVSSLFRVAAPSTPAEVIEAFAEGSARGESSLLLNPIYRLARIAAMQPADNSAACARMQAWRLASS